MGSYSDKWKYTLQTTLLAFILFHKSTFKFMSDKTQFKGFKLYLLHLLIFTLILRVLMG